MIASFAYEDGILEIEFRKGGAVWHYFDFPEHMWHEFTGAESHGKYWHENIKNRFREARIG